ncbi:hypothetical protein C8A03DRAFT_35099 [Achaetomium macrosporum]|uniref:Uncharacterized protein n=1 Tax=Achaetomium macrosporum TaxID=79813 RepID=A0AAN7H690_9PEZI|nr:hypothetical protein C8A03DRAFT_35099 [Achaetomium macrosporum]
MKTISLLLSAGLASARFNLPNQAGLNSLAGINLNNNDGSNLGDAEGLNLGSLNLGDLDLNGLEIGGLNLGNVDLGNQDVVAEAILAMLGSLCLGDAFSLNNILSFGFNNDVDLFFQLAQLMQLEQLGFVDLGGIHSLFNSGLVLGGFNLGVFKREIEEVKKTMKRTKLRRGQNVKRQCATGGAPTATSAEEGSFTIATVPNPVAPPTATALTATEDSATATVASSSVASTSASVTIATTASATSVVQALSSSTSVASAATSVAAAASEVTASVATAAQQVAASSSPAEVIASVTSDASVPVAAATSAAAAAGAAGRVDNLADLTR